MLGAGSASGTDDARGAGPSERFGPGTRTPLGFCGQRSRARRRWTRQTAVKPVKVALCPPRRAAVDLDAVGSVVGMCRWLRRIDQSGHS